MHRQEQMFDDQVVVCVKALSFVDQVLRDQWDIQLRILEVHIFTQYTA
jgi:hypothetical protein